MQSIKEGVGGIPFHRGHDVRSERGARAHMFCTRQADGKRHINGRPAQGEKLLGDPAAVQSLAAMVQATGVGLSPAIDREQTTKREKKIKLITSSLCAETSGRSYAFPSNLPYYVYNFATLKSLNTCRRRCSYSHEPIRVELTSCGRS